MSMLGFDVSVANVDENTMTLKFIFRNPLSVSIGKTPDIMNIRFTEPELFLSKESGKSLSSDTSISKTFPK